MRLIGLTGRSGSGKSTVGECARQLGIPVLDCDRIYRELTDHPSECLLAIRDTFGEDTVRDGALNRSALREIVFHDPDALQKLNALTAQYMTAEIHSRLAAVEAPFAILDAPTLFDCGMNTACDAVLCTVSSDADCISRICLRDQITREDAMLRLRQQHDNAFFIAHCDWILYNEGGQEAFRADATALLSAILHEEYSI